MSADAAPAKTAAPAKAAASKVAKVKKVAKPATHPSYLEMITDAVTAFDAKDQPKKTARKGSSMASIKNYIRANYTGVEDKKMATFVKANIKRMVDAGTITQVKGTGALAEPPRALVLGQFKLAEKPTKKVAKAATKSPKKVAKSPKKTAKSPKKVAKKSVKKVTKTAKPAKKAAKSPAKKPVAKKAKKPAAKKTAAKK